MGPGPQLRFNFSTRRDTILLCNRPAPPSAKGATLFEEKIILSHSKGHNIPRPLSLMLSFLLLGILLSACATGQKTGIRKDFEQHQVRTLAVASFYSGSNFGMSPQEFDEVRELYEAAATGALRTMGFDVVDPRAFHQHLVELQVWEPFQDGVRLHRPLTSYFELGGPKAPVPVEVLTLQAIAGQASIPVEAVLFGELVYHSQGICRTETALATPYAQISKLAGAPDALPRPCVTSHFQAKLVDVQTGQTMWFNRMFVETHARHIDKELAKENIRRAVFATISERAGLAPLAASGEKQQE